MVIEYYEKNVYGNEMEYVADPDIAATIRILTGQKTIKISHRMALGELGIEFKRVLRPHPELKVLPQER